MSTTTLPRDRMSVESTESILQYTEGMHERLFRMDAEGNTGFLFDAEQHAASGGTTGEGASTHPSLEFYIGEDVFAISPESVSQAFKLIGLPVGYAENTPMNLVFPHLQYWFANKGGENKALIKDGRVVSFCRPGTSIYSTTKLLDSIFDGGLDRDTSSIVNFYHDIYETHFTVLDESFKRPLPDGSVLIGGVQFQTSLVGLKPLSMSPFVLRSTERSTAGEVELYEGGSMSTAFPELKWDRHIDSRRLKAPPEEAELLDDAYSFTRQAVSTIMDGIDEEFERVAGLRTILLDQHAGPFLDDIIKKYKLPPRIYNPVMQEFMHSSSKRSALDLWMGFGHVGLRDLDLTPRLKRMVFQTSGEIARHPAMCSSCHRSLPSFTDE